LISPNWSGKLLRVGVVVHLIRRCAWCDRIWADGAWKDSVAQSDHETATICPDCAKRLEELGMTASAYAGRRQY